MARTNATRLNLNNIIVNGDMEFAPNFTAATTTTSRFVDGTAAGSATNNQFFWSFSKSGTASAQFDTSTAHTGTTSLKASTLATASYIEMFYRKKTGGVGGYNVITELNVLPSTSYTFSYWLKTNLVSGDSNDGVFVQLIENKADGTSTGTESTVGAKVKTTVDWVLKTVTFTTSSTTNSIQIDPRIYGHTGTGTLIIDAWFDDMTLGLTTPVVRGVA